MILSRCCSVSGGGGSGVLLLGGLVQVTLSGCEMRDLGGDGVGAVWGTSFDAINTTVTDCVVEGSGFIFMDQPTGVRAMGAADGVVTITHNHIRDSSYAGVMAGWCVSCGQTIQRARMLLLFITGILVYARQPRQCRGATSYRTISLRTAGSQFYPISLAFTCHRLVR